MNNLDELDIDDDILFICTICGEAPTYVDRLKQTWCDTHSYRGELIDWGKTHNWPMLESDPYTIVLCNEEIVVRSKIEGQQEWVMHAAFGTEACVLALLVVALSKEMEVA